MKIKEKIESESDYIEKLADRITVAFDGAWASEHEGSIEILEGTQKLLVSGLSTIIAMLINKRVLDIKELRSSLEQGWLIKEVEE